MKKTQEDLLNSILRAVDLLQRENLGPTQLSELDEVDGTLWDLLDEQDGR